MRCEAARALVSDRVDTPLDERAAATVETHLAACAACRRFEARLAEVRRHLHLAPVGAAPDVAGPVRRTLENGSTRRGRSRRSGRAGPSVRAPRRWLPPVAAAFVAAFALGAAIVGLTGPPEAEATDLAALVQAGQRELATLTANVEVIEHGWHPDVPTRRFAGRLDYRAPETLVLRLEDLTVYPDDAWRPGHVVVEMAEGVSWTSGRPGCPPAALPDCTPEAPRTRAVAGREPFDPLDPVPLDLVLPVSSFAFETSEATLGASEVAGRAAVGVEVTAAQLAPLLEGLHRVGNWRPVHPTDAASVWLDAELGLPLAFQVSAQPGFERDRWAAASGLDDAPGGTVLAWRLSDVRVNAEEPGDVVRQAGTDSTTDRGFRDDPAAGLVPDWLPEGMAAHRAGRIGDVEVASFADGRAWVAVRSTRSWDGRRLFGRHDGVVRPVDLGDAGTGYQAEGGARVLLHGSSIDVEVVGSLATSELVQVAASLGVEGHPVPAGWREASTLTLDQAASDWPGLLTLPSRAGGVAAPAVTSSEHGVVQSFAGSGARAVVLVQSPGDRLGPPVDDVVVGVQVRGRAARYTPDRGSLEWVEDERVVTLRSRTLRLEELVGLAELLEPVP